MDKNMTFEDAATALEATLEKMSNEKISLEESIQLYAKAAQYALFCDEYLKKAAIQIEEIDAQYQAMQECAEKEEY